jgi:hypothetical protein
VEEKEEEEEKFRQRDTESLEVFACLPSPRTHHSCGFSTMLSTTLSSNLKGTRGMLQAKQQAVTQMGIMRVGNQKHVRSPDNPCPNRSTLHLFIPHPPLTPISSTKPWHWFCPCPSMHFPTLLSSPLTNQESNLDRSCHCLIIRGIVIVAPPPRIALPPVAADSPASSPAPACLGTRDHHEAVEPMTIASRGGQHGRRVGDCSPNRSQGLERRQAPRRRHVKCQYGLRHCSQSRNKLHRSR